MSDILTATAPPAPRTVHRWPIVLLRTFAVIALLQVLVQAALAGGFITGRIGYLTAHSLNGSVLIMTVGGMGLAAILVFRPGRGPWWPILFSVVLWWLCAFQVAFGFARQVGLHIPLGVTIMALISVFTWWTLTYRPGTRRVAA